MNKKMQKCKTCGSEIAINAKTCPNCGAKNKSPLDKYVGLIVLCVIVFLGIVIGTAKNDVKEDETTIQVNNTVATVTNAFTGDCGITAKAEMGDSIIGMPELTIVVKNTTEKDIAAVKFYAVPCDVYGDEIKGWTRQDHLYTDTTIAPGDTDTLVYQFIENTVKTVKLYVYSVYFTDGTEWGDKDATTSDIVKNGKIIEVSIVE